MHKNFKYCKFNHKKTIGYFNKTFRNNKETANIKFQKN